MQRQGGEILHCELHRPGLERPALGVVGRDGEGPDQGVELGIAVAAVVPAARVLLGAVGLEGVDEHVLK
jgi:hypothetical protein